MISLFRTCLTATLKLSIWPSDIFTPHMSAYLCVMLRLIFSSLLYEHVFGHGQHYWRSHCLGLPQAHADGANSVHT